ncbi:MAG: hypothetical protein ABEJ73_03845 [Haloplanus sp.]
MALSTDDIGEISVTERAPIGELGNALDSTKVRNLLEYLDDPDLKLGPMKRGRPVYHTESDSQELAQIGDRIFTTTYFETEFGGLLYTRTDDGHDSAIANIDEESAQIRLLCDDHAPHSGLIVPQTSPGLIGSDDGVTAHRAATSSELTAIADFIGGDPESVDAAYIADREGFTVVRETADGSDFYDVTFSNPAQLEREAARPDLTADLTSDNITVESVTPQDSCKVTCLSCAASLGRCGWCSSTCLAATTVVGALACIGCFTFWCGWSLPITCKECQECAT